MLSMFIVLVLFFLDRYLDPRVLHSFPTRRSSDLRELRDRDTRRQRQRARAAREHDRRSEEHTSELQSHHDLVCRLLLEKKKEPAAIDPHSAKVAIAG